LKESSNFGNLPSIDFTCESGIITPPSLIY
jgi:hypothetical protein